MKNLIYLILLLNLFFSNIYSQVCNSNRYLQPIFNQVEVVNGVEFGVADPYGLIDNQTLRLDIYRPIGDTLTKRPVIIYAFGGGFLIGTRNQPPIPYFGDWFAKMGYVFISIDYRIGFNTVTPGSPERAVYRAVQDLRSAVRHVAQRFESYGIDTNKIVYMGSSAGCFAGLHSAFMEYSEADAFDNPIPILDSEILGAIDYAGNNDYGNRHINPFAIVNLWGAIADTAFIDSDEHFPVISFHGDQDNAVPYNYGYPFSYPVFPNVYGSNPIHMQLDNVGVRNELHTLVGFGHEPELLNLDLRDTIIQNSAFFLHELLKPETGAILGENEVCSGTQQTYSVNLHEGSRYCWLVSGPATIISNTSNSITLSFTSPGNVVVSCREISINAASGDEVIKNISVYAQPVVNISIINQQELDVTFNFSVQNQQQLTLFPGNNQLIQPAANTYSYSSPGTYQVVLEAKNEVCYSYDTIIVIVDTCPVALFTIEIEQTFVQFTAINTNTNNYSWQFGDGNSLTNSTPSAINFYSTSGWYTAQLIVQNSLGCSDTFQMIVNLLPDKVSEIEINNLVIYPNPVKGVIFIESKTSQNAVFKILDLEGRETKSGIILGMRNLIDLSDLTSGVYYLNFGTNSNFKILKD